jgi:hypothetical protein
MVEELRKVIPSFLKRLDIPDRGVAWTEYLANTKGATRDLVMSMTEAHEEMPTESVRLVDFDPDGEQRVLEAIVFANSRASRDDVVRTVRRLSDLQRAQLFATYVGNRANRRHRPGRAFEATDYRFEIVSDYGAFRDLQRHRLLSIEWQPLTAELGYDVPDIVREAGLGDRFEESLHRSADLYRDMRDEFPEQSQYCIALAFRIRYEMQMNAREAMHLIELRSGPQGHPNYRRVVQEMARLIRDQAGHRAIAGAMTYIDFSDTDLERLEAARNAERNRQNC